jgi:hypothetical protein
MDIGFKTYEMPTPIQHVDDLAKHAPRFGWVWEKNEDFYVVSESHPRPTYWPEDEKKETYPTGWLPVENADIQLFKIDRSGEISEFGKTKAVTNFVYNSSGLEKADDTLNEWYHFWNIDDMPEKGAIFKVTDKACTNQCNHQQNEEEFLGPCLPVFLDRTLLWIKGNEEYIVKAGGKLSDDLRPNAVWRDTMKPSLTTGTPLMARYNKNRDFRLTLTNVCSRSGKTMAPASNHPFQGWRGNVEKRVIMHGHRENTAEEYAKIVNINAGNQEMCASKIKNEKSDCTYMMFNNVDKGLPHVPHVHVWFVKNRKDILFDQNKLCNWNNIVNGTTSNTIKKDIYLQDGINRCSGVEWTAPLYGTMRTFSDKCQDSLQTITYLNWNTLHEQSNFQQCAIENHQGDLFVCAKSGCDDDNKEFRVCGVTSRTCDENNEDAFETFVDFNEYRRSRTTESLKE